MSVVALPAAPLSVDLAEAAGRDEKVIFHSLGCQRSRDANAAVFLGLLGPVPFGMLIGKLKCTRCQGKLGVILPWYAPTPQLWVKQYRPEAQREQVFDVDGFKFPCQVELCDKNGDPERPETLTRQLEVAHFAFEHLTRIRPADHFIVRSKMLVLRDSKRDYKVVDSSI